MIKHIPPKEGKLIIDEGIRVGIWSDVDSYKTWYIKCSYEDLDLNIAMLETSCNVLILAYSDVGYKDLIAYLILIKELGIVGWTYETNDYDENRCLFYE